jgi:predicted permease
MENVFSHIRLALRTLLKNPGFAAVAVIALALGIGANTAIFSIIYATMFEPMSYYQPDRVVMVWSKIHEHRNSVSPADYLDWKEQSSAFQSLAAWSGNTINLSAGARPEQVRGFSVTPGFFQVIGQSVALGREFLPEEGQLGKDRVAILNHQFWIDRFCADPSVIGRVITVDGESRTIVGVIGSGPLDRGREKMFLPLAFSPSQLNSDTHWVLVLGRLKDGATVTQANADMDRVTQHLAEAHPKTDAGWGASVEPLKNDFLDRDTVRGLWLLMGAVGFVLLIACANVANLLLARATSRTKEVAVRAALGATRWQLFHQFLTESLVLAFVGGAAGIALAWGLLKVVMRLMPPFTLPYEADVRQTHRRAERRWPLRPRRQARAAAAARDRGVCARTEPAYRRRARDSQSLERGARRPGLQPRSHSGFLSADSQCELDRLRADPQFLPPTRRSYGRASRREVHRDLRTRATRIFKLRHSFHHRRARHFRSAAKADGGI